MSESIKVLTHYDQVPSIDVAGRYWRWIMHHGAQFYIENMDLSIKALSIAGKIIPLVINQGKSQLSDVCSPYAHYLMYTAEEFRRLHSIILGLAVPMLVFPFSILLGCASIDRWCSLTTGCSLPILSLSLSRGAYSCRDRFIASGISGLRYRNTFGKLTSGSIIAQVPA